MSQETVVSDSILIESSFSGNVFKYHGEKVRLGKALSLMENNDEAYNLMADAQESYIFGNLFCMIGSVLLVYPIASSFFDTDPNWVIAASGGGLILISVPIFVKFNKQSTEAVLLYNGSLGNVPTSKVCPVIDLGFSASGFGIRYNF